MALRCAGQQLRVCWQRHLSQQYSKRHCTTATASKVKRPEQMTDDELNQSLPSMLFTTSNLLWSTTLAVGVAAAGLLAMFWVGTFITGAANSLRHLEQPLTAPAPPPQKTLAELIAERKAELEDQLQELQQLPRLPETKQAIADIKKELRQYRDPNTPWWKRWG
eukprot:GHRR01003590.1.p1 GENE.GHRR01003590.1~~GHRR01003590.1.p1  ORF type:complete len:164 (+),score=45.17 GHRR01003590.1:264-755(+)